MSAFTLLVLGFVVCGAWQSTGYCETVLFEDTFDNGLSDKWEMIGLHPDDYRVQAGSLQLRLKQASTDNRALLKVNLPFSTADTVVASVTVKAVADMLPPGAFAGLCLTTQNDVEFMVRKTNIDGYFVLSPGEVDFIGKPGQEGDPGKYTVKYWPADESFGPLRLLVRGHYAYFQVGPSESQEYKTLFHSAITQSGKGMGFALTASAHGSPGRAERWVQFDDFRVTVP